MVSIAATSKKYHGRKAATYDEIRTKQQRWRLENEAVERMLRQLQPKWVLDVPCGTGRFFELYRVLDCSVTAVDVSEEMLALAKAKLRKGHKVNLVHCGIEDIPKDNFDAAVCVRFLDLIDEQAMHVAVRTLCGAAQRAVILTIRLGAAYVPKVNTAEHDEKKFRALVKRLGWRVAEQVPVFNAGWHIIRLERV
jgi:2-polyprenyl-3-methyl-5-hydroxy-6-metoxy-1,4-benzoquinol methylase